jgi:hypothetical protein
MSSHSSLHHPSAVNRWNWILRVRFMYELLGLCALAGASPRSARSQVPAQVTPAAADSADPINPDRPGIADGSRVIRRGQLELEIGVQQERRHEGDTRTTTTFVPLLLRIGVAERLEARIEGNSLTSTSATGGGASDVRITGYSPVSLGAKYEIFDAQGENRLSLGLIARVFPPTGSSDFRSHRSAEDLRLAADWDFAPGLSLNPNVGIARLDDGAGGVFVATLGALTLTYAPTERINPFVDVGAQTPEAPRGAAAITLDAGLGYIIGRDIQVDVSAGRGVHGSTPPHPFVAIGLSLRTGRI